uniref:Uncharacterized protein n=1 Tax=Haptolina ericina TaxID=156174 RepID=A0A7S3AGP1_9EUKA|mmetsp:Transcript_15744/g.35309  ORF Transcript_15744/g.35309 Transcript_15744/m.35309 type:complete len:159 (+) Transcript_15744:15-491(+)
MLLLIISLGAASGLLVPHCGTGSCGGASRYRSIRASTAAFEPESATCTLISKVKTAPDEVTFASTMAVVEAEYVVTEVSFSVGPVKSAAGSNMGSAKVFSLGKMHDLSEAETLGLFGEIYRDVVATPSGDDHPNIRAFMAEGWSGVDFPDGIALAPAE